MSRGICPKRVSALRSKATGGGALGDKGIGDFMTKKLMRASIAALAVAMSVGTANAQTGELISNPRGMVANFDAVNLGPVLTELGIVWQERQLSDGRTFIAASIGAALNFSIVPAACLSSDGRSNCVGMNVITLFTGGAPNPQSVSAFNQKYVFTSAGMYSDGSSAFLSRYDIADYGIPRGNVASSIYTFFQLAQRFRDEIATKTVSADGYADDMSAGALNVSSGKAIGVDVAVVTDSSTAALHQASLEATPELVRRLIASDNAPRNKISNITKK